MHVTPIEEAAKQAEEAIGNNIVFLTDCLDLSVRQKDPKVLAALKALNDAHIALCKAGAHKVGLEVQTPIHNYAR